MVNNQIELDDEISNLYLGKDMDKLWQRWNSCFSNKSCKPSNIDGLTDNEHVYSSKNERDNTSIANHFSDSFASVYFDSYQNNADVVACLEKLQSLEMLEKGNTDKNVVSG